MVSDVKWPYERRQVTQSLDYRSIDEVLALIAEMIFKKFLRTLIQNIRPVYPNALILCLFPYFRTILRATIFLEALVSWEDWPDAKKFAAKISKHAKNYHRSRELLKKKTYSYRFRGQSRKNGHA